MKRTYHAWYEIGVASALNAHIRYLVESLAAGHSIDLSYLDPSVEIPLYKRTFKTKPTAISVLIRTSSVGRDALLRVRDRLLAENCVIKQRRSPKLNILNQVAVILPTNDPMYPIHVRHILEVVADELDRPMPSAMVVGYHVATFSPHLPGQLTINKDFRKAIFRPWGIPE